MPDGPPLPESTAPLARNASSGPEILETIAAADLLAAWRRDFGIDVGPLFDGVETLRLCRDPATLRIYFDPPIAGTPAFYGQLHSFDWYRPVAKAEHRFASGCIGPADRVLDIGAGEGAFADFVAGADYKGLEFDSGSVRQGRLLGRDLSDQPPSRLAAEIDTGREPGFTVVTAFQVLEHLAEPDDFLVTALRCLAPGGRLILGLPDAESYLSALPDFVLNAPPHHLTWWSDAALGRLLRRQGLRDIEFRRFPVEPWERRLWWMARTARFIGGGQGPRFGRSLRRRKACSWLAAGLLQAIAPPADARGATLVAVARKP